jgi:hypothetical protein
MDSNALVDFQIDAGQRVITRLVRDGFPVEAAFWARTTEEDIWFLYIASPVVEEKGPMQSYRALQASLQQLQGIPLSLSDIKLIGRTNPITRDVITILNNRYPGSLATRYGGRRLGDMSIHEIYIYPSHLYDGHAAGPMTQDEIVRELFRLMNRGPGSVPASRITLKDGDVFTGLPFSVQSASHRPMIIQFVEEGELTPRVLGIDEIASIQ